MEQNDQVTSPATNESAETSTNRGWLDQGGADNIFFGLVAFLIIMGIGLYTKDWMTAILVGVCAGAIIWLFFKTPVGKKIITTMMNFFIWCGGVARADIAKMSGKDQLLYAGIGMVLFVPAFQAFYNGYMTAVIVYGCSSKRAFMAGFACFMVIFIVDRMFVVTMKRLKNMKYSPHSLVIRIAFAVFLGIVLSLATEINLFKSEIQEEYITEMDEAKASIEAGETADLAAVDVKIETAKAKVESRYQDFMAEVDQNIGGRKAAYGPVAKKKEALWKEAKDDYEQNVLPKLQAEKNAISVKYASKRTRMEDNFSYGFASRVEYLMKAGERHPAIGILHLFILVLMILIDIVPVLAKTLMEPTQYEYDLAASTAEWEKKALDKQIELESARIAHEEHMVTKQTALEAVRQNSDFTLEANRVEAIMATCKQVDAGAKDMGRNMDKSFNFLEDRIINGYGVRGGGGLFSRIFGSKKEAEPVG